MSHETIYRLSDDTAVKVLKTDYQHPLVVEKSLFSGSLFLYIDPDWYLDNQHLVDNLICYIAKNTENQELNIKNGCLINKNLIDSLCENSNLETIDIGILEDDSYKLTYEDYLKLKKSSIKCVNSDGVEESLKENFEPLIGYNFNRKLINYYKYSDLNNNKIYLNKELSEEEIENLKYIGNNTDIQLSEEGYLSFQKICEKLKSLNKDNNVILNIDNKLEFNNFIFKNKIVDYNNIFVKLGITTLPIKNYLKFERILYQMIEPAKNLSPFEKYVYAYNLTKQYKKYKKNEIDKSASRNLYSILENEYMVCVGFSNMFGDLLDKLGIENYDLSVSVDISYDDVKKGEEILKEKLVESSGHARRYIHIVDEKYGIDGFYVSDPTWDNDLDNDYYNYLALTDKEIISTRRYLWINTYGINELFNVNSIQEFYQKINFLLDRKKNNFNFLLDSDGNDNRLRDIIKSVINIIRDLDKNFVDNLTQKYDYIKTHFGWPKEFYDLIYDLGNYIVDHVNKSISGNTIMSAVEEVYRETSNYSEEELQQKLLDIRQKNKERQEICFPKRYIEYEDGRKEIYDNETNKFDIEYIPNKVI